ncbi:hypothetical protein ACOM2C_02075 [Pseudarthrobacter sp. So.54]
MIAADIANVLTAANARRNPFSIESLWLPAAMIALKTATPPSWMV